MTDPYLALVIIFVLAGLIVLALIFVAQNVGPKTLNAVKAEPFESGNPPRGDARARFSVSFYLVSLLFLLFYLYVVFLYPWEVVFLDVGLPALIAVGIFLAILVIGFIYEWRKGALEWD
jgi:NADH-quinone oxidoreductase subunit A